MLLTSLTAGISVGLVAIGIIDDDTTQLIIFGAGLAWLVPAMIVYTRQGAELEPTLDRPAADLAAADRSCCPPSPAIITDSISLGDPWCPLAAAGASCGSRLTGHRAHRAAPLSPRPARPPETKRTRS
jgi:hypothetical protein